LWLDGIQDPAFKGYIIEWERYLKQSVTAINRTDGIHYETRQLEIKGQILLWTPQRNLEAVLPYFSLELPLPAALFLF
jgi:hypothetical protein